MSLQPQQPIPVPEQTARVARSAFPHRKNVYMKMRDELGAIYDDETFAHLFPRRGQPGETPWRLALVTIMQFAEGLSDRRAADAVRARIDWKYALSLELDDPGFDGSVLSEFRTRLLSGGAERLLLDKLLDRFCELKLLKAGGRQRTDSTHVLAAVRALNRFELVKETMRRAIEWRMNMLDKAEQTLFRGLSVCRGGWDAEGRARTDGAGAQSLGCAAPHAAPPRK